MKVTLKDDTLPEGKELYVKGLGMLVNGKAVDFSADQVEAFEALRGVKLDQAFKHNPTVSVGRSGSEGERSDD